MFSFSQYITELFDREYNDVELVGTTNYGRAVTYKFEFKVSGSPFRVHVNAHINIKEIEVEFAAGSDKIGWNIAINNSGHYTSVGVFSRVGYCLKRVLKDHPDFTICFSASDSEPSRVKLYRVIARQIAKALGKQFTVSENEDEYVFRIK